MAYRSRGRNLVYFLHGTDYTADRFETHDCDWIRGGRDTLVGHIDFYPAVYYIIFFSMLHGPAVLGIFFVTATYLDSECDESVRSTAQSLLYFSLMSGQIAGYLCGSIYVGSFEGLKRTEAIQHGFFLFAMIALGVSLFFQIMVAKEKTTT